MAEKKQIKMFFWEGWTSVAPTIINLANSFGENGHLVTIYTRFKRNKFAPSPNYHSNVKVMKIRETLILRYFQAFLRRIKLPEFQIFRSTVFYFNFIIRIKSLLIPRRFSTLIGIDGTGLHWANSLKPKQSTIVYLSLEIQDRVLTYNQDNLSYYIKEQERKIHRNFVSLTLIQDLFRWDILRRANNLSLTSAGFAILTNSPRAGDHRRSFEGNFYESRLGIDPGTFKILSAGVIDDSVLSAEVASAFKSFIDKEVYLIYHERVKRDRNESYLKQIQELGGKRLILSLDPVPYELIWKVYASADVGLVFYNKAFGSNYSSIIGASGKLSHYLKYGLPVIALDLPGFKDLFEEYNCGIVISHPDKLQEAYEAIRRNYDMMKKGALSCYKECYDFDNQFQNIYRKWGSLFVIQ